MQPHPEYPSNHPLPTRRSLRTQAAAPTRRDLHRSRRKPRRGLPRPNRRTLRTALVAGIFLPGMLAPVVLPAFALAPSAPTLLQADSEAQNFVANGGSAPVVGRDEYTAQRSAPSTGRIYDAEHLAQYRSPSEAGWWRPVAGPVTSVYGPRRLICNGAGCSSPFHEGVDFGDACGTPIRAAGDGVVSFVGDAGAFGYRVIVDHPDGARSFYGHGQTNSAVVEVGDTVSGGDTLSLVGKTGVVTGCHLDLKFTVDGENVDPAEFLAARGVDATK